MHRFLPFGKCKILRLCSELQLQVAKVDEQVALAVKKFKSSAKFTEEKLLFSKEAYSLAAKETWQRIAQQYPDLDLSFLKEEGYCASLPADPSVASHLSTEAEFEEGTLDIDFEEIVEVDSVVALHAAEELTQPAPFH